VLRHCAELILRSLNFTEDSSAPFQQHLAFGRKTHAPRAALKEPHANALFKSGNAFADG
jgi:hypothetical protein